MMIFWILVALLGLTAVLICYSACVVSSRENYVPRDYYEAVVEELCHKHTEEIASMPDIVRCKECKYSSDDGTYGCMCDHFNGLDDVYHRMYADDFCSWGERSE